MMPATEMTATGDEFTVKTHAPREIQIHHERALWTAQLLAVIVPVGVAIAFIATKRWGAPSDWGNEVMRTHDVGGAHSPFVGAHGRFGWAHPGPMLFYVEAPFVKAFGATGMLIGAGVINLTSLVTVMVLARRRGGVALASIVGLLCLVLCRSLTFDFLVNPWNPWIAALPFFALLFTCWSIAEGDRWCLPVAAILASFVVQSHVGYALVTVTAVATCVFIVGIRNRRQLRKLASRSTGPLVVAAGTGLVLWLPPIVQQLTHLNGGGNLAMMVKYFATGDQPTVGGHYGLRALAFQVSPFGPWLTGKEPTIVAPMSVSVPVCSFVAVVTAVGGFAWWRGDRSVGHLLSICAAVLITSWVSLSRITNLPFMYLMRWTWVIAAMLVLLLAWSVRSLLQSRQGSRPSRTTRGWASGGRYVTPISTVALVIFAVTLIPSAHVVNVPFATGSETALALSDRAEPVLQKSQTYVIRWQGVDLMSGLSVGIATTLELRGYRIVWDADIEPSVGAHRIIKSGESAQLLHGYNITGSNGPWQPPKGESVIVRYRSPGPDPQSYVLTLGPFPPS